MPTSNIDVSYMERHITSGAADATMNCETTMSYDIGYKAIYKKFNVRLVRDPSDSAIEFSIAWPPHREGYVVLSHFNFTFEMNDVVQALLNKLNSPEGKAEVNAIWSSTLKSSTIEIDPLEELRKNFDELRKTVLDLGVELRFILKALEPIKLEHPTEYYRLVELIDKYFSGPFNGMPDPNNPDSPTSIWMCDFTQNPDV